MKWLTGLGVISCVDAIQRFQERQPYYKGCSVDESWHCFEVFEKWYNEQEQRNFKEDYHVGRRWSIDKDILVRGNKVYSHKGLVVSYLTKLTLL